MPKKILLITVVILLILGAYFLGSKKATAVLAEGSRFDLSTPSGVLFSVYNSPEEIGFSITSNKHGLLVGYVSDDNIELRFSDENESELITTFDLEGDGVPNHRIIRNLISGDVVQVEPQIDWIDVNAHVQP